MITALFREGPLDARTLQIDSAPAQLFVTQMFDVADGNVEHFATTPGGYVLVEGTQIDFARRAQDGSWFGFTVVADGVVYAWNDELLPNL